VPGILTAEELATLDLHDCELAVLSACETNVGIRRAGQGIQSLQTALHAAGARTAITSLWKVEDKATRRLFELFYSKLWKEGLGKAEALWQAKMTLCAEGHPPRDWTGWVLSGDPD
jgi:CHAT domain-containing protein